MFCPQCGTAHTPGGRFCGNCGLLLPFAAMAGISPDPGATRADSSTSTTRGATRHSTISVPSLTLAVVACVVAFGLMFVAASAVLRSVLGDPMEHSVSAQARSPSLPQGAMGALLSSGRRTAPADPTDPAQASRRR
jgi:hypothetical protein